MIVVAGESLIDIAMGPEGPVETVGGSPLNVAVALGRLEAPALLITEIGQDERAGRILGLLHASEVEVIGAPSHDGVTPTATVHLDSGEPVYTVNLDWRLPHQELPACDALHVGSLGTVLEPGRDSVLDLVEQAWARDVFVSFDPNVRAGHRAANTADTDGFDQFDDQAWGDIEALADRAQLVKLSEQDIELLHPGADPDTIARSLLTGEATELVILTRGERGATAFTDGLVVDVPGRRVEVVDTVGAGDAFMAAVLAVLLETGSFGHFSGGVPHDQDRLESLLRAAVEVAAISCERQGAATPLRSELPAPWPA